MPAAGTPQGCRRHMRERQDGATESSNNGLADLAGVGPAAGQIPSAHGRAATAAVLLLVDPEGLALGDPGAGLAHLARVDGDDHLVLDAVVHPVHELSP